MMQLKQRLMNFYQILSSGSVDSLSELYHQQIQFQDPVDCVNGIDELRTYFAKLMANTKTCHFKFHDSDFRETTGWIQWTMTFSHPRINQGVELAVDGLSLLEYNNGKITAQRDYYDLGQMIYERIPVVGKLILWIKRGLSK